MTDDDGQAIDVYATSDFMVARIDSIVFAAKSLGEVKDPEAREIVLDAMRSVGATLKPKAELRAIRK